MGWRRSTNLQNPEVWLEDYSFTRHHGYTCRKAVEHKESLHLRNLLLPAAQKISTRNPNTLTTNSNRTPLNTWDNPRHTLQVACLHRLIHALTCHAKRRNPQHFYTARIHRGTVQHNLGTLILPRSRIRTAKTRHQVTTFCRRSNAPSDTPNHASLSLAGAP